MSNTAKAELLPGYYIDPDSGAWKTIPWPSGPEDLPESIGLNVIEWCESTLIHHLDSSSWRFTAGQKRFLILWYSVRWDKKTNRFKWIYRSGVKRGAKGVGKDPLAATIALAELAGPVIPFLNEWGDLDAKAHDLSLVQIAANSEAQASDVLRVANAMVSADLSDEIGYDPGITRSLTASGSKIELLTFSEKSSEGDPATAILLNESHHMTHTSGGQRLAAVARRNVAKSPGGVARLVELTNAHMPGEGSVAEDSFAAWQAQVAGKTKRRDILYDSIEADPALRLQIEEELELGISQAYSDSPWTDPERIRDEAQDLRTPVADSVRFYFNALPTHENAWCEPRAFDALARPEELLADGDEIALFLDCSKSEDATTLVGCRISDGFVFGLGSWQRPHGDRGKGWLAPRETVDAVVRSLMDRYAVQWFGVDPSPAKDDSTEALYWGPTIDKWHADFKDDLPLWATPGRTQGNAVLFDMRMSSPGGKERNRIFTEQAEQTILDIEEDKTLEWDGDPILRVHVHQARRRPNQWGISLGKRTRDSSKLVDYAVTMVGARLGRRLVQLHAPKKKQRSGMGYFA